MNYALIQSCDVDIKNGQRYREVVDIHCGTVALRYLDCDVTTLRYRRLVAPSLRI
jgi:hypothetical protein